MSPGKKAPAKKAAKKKAASNAGKKTSKTTKPVQREDLIERNDGRKLDRMTLYLEWQLSERLRVYCAKNRLDMSRVINAALDRYLAWKDR